MARKRMVCRRCQNVGRHGRMEYSRIAEKVEIVGNERVTTHSYWCHKCHTKSNLKKVIRKMIPPPLFDTKKLKFPKLDEFDVAQGEVELLKRKDLR